VGWRDIILWVCGIALATALTIFGTVMFVNWIAPSDPYGKMVPGGTGVRNDRR
jgi:hypothetical protein